MNKEVEYWKLQLRIVVIGFVIIFIIMLITIALGTWIESKPSKDIEKQIIEMYEPYIDELGIPYPCYADNFDIPFPCWSPPPSWKDGVN